MAKQQQFGLGKGLGALLGGEDLTELRKPVGYINKQVVTAEVKPKDTSDVLRIPVDLIEPNPYQPRMNFDNEALRELADSIRTFGLIQPITVRRKGDGKYQIISGERRYRASIMAGMDMIPAYIRDASEQGMLEMAIVENIQRENLDPIEVAMSYQRLMEECRLTQEQMADRVGKKRASVANQLRLLKLPAKVQHDLKVGLVSVGHAKVLLGVENPALQEALCDAIVKHGLSVRQLEDKIQSLGTKSVSPKAAAEPVELPQMYYRLLENLGRYVGENSLSLRRSKDGKSAITIRFASDSQAEPRKHLQILLPFSVSRSSLADWPARTRRLSKRSPLVRRSSLVPIKFTIGNTGNCPLCMAGLAPASTAESVVTSCTRAPRTVNIRRTVFYLLSGPGCFTGVPSWTGPLCSRATKNRTLPRPRFIPFCCPAWDKFTTERLGNCPFIGA